MVIISFQRPVYKTLYIRKEVYEFYKDHLRTFYFSLTIENESITMIGIYKELKKEIKYIDHYNILFSADRINNILLKR